MTKKLTLALARFSRAEKSDLATLKRKGVIGGFDARSVQPTKSLKSALRKFQGVLSGSHVAVKLPQKQIKEFRSTGAPIVKPKGKPARAILQKPSIDAKVNVSHGKVNFRTPGVQSRPLPTAKVHDLESYLNNAPPLKRDEYYGFRFEGNNSMAVFRSVDLMLEYLNEHYKAVGSAAATGRRKDMDQLIKMVEVVTIKRSQAESFMATRKRKSPEYIRHQRQRRFKKVQSNPDKYEKYLDTKAAEQKAFRAKVKAEGGAAYEKYLAAARKRKKKNTKKKSTKKRSKR